MGHDLGGLLAVEHGEVLWHVHVHVVHGALGQATVGLGPGWGCPGPRVGAWLELAAVALAGGGAPRGAGARDHGDGLHQAGPPGPASTAAPAWAGGIAAAGGQLRGDPKTMKATNTGSDDEEGHEMGTEEKEREIYHDDFLKEAVKI